MALELVFKFAIPQYFSVTFWYHDFNGIRYYDICIRASSGLTPGRRIRGITAQVLSVEPLGTASRPRL